MKKSECATCSSVVAGSDENGKNTKLECGECGLPIEKVRGCPLALIRAVDSQRRPAAVA